MKKNHEEVISYIHKAIQACGSDHSFEEAKRYLSVAINSINKVAKKRINQETQRQYYEAQGKKKQEEWWEMIRRNAKKNSDIVDTEE